MWRVWGEVTLWKRTHVLLDACFERVIGRSGRSTKVDLRR